VPCGGSNGKVTLREWRRFQSFKPYPVVIDAWAKRYPQANIGILTGPLYNLTVLDDDRQRPTTEVFRQFGETPLVVSTPRGGAHYYYGYNGETSATAISDGLDIKSKGGLVIAPPSARPSDGLKYSFKLGGWNELAHLPKIKSGALEGLIAPPKPAHRTKSADRWQFVGEPIVREGERGDFIFYQALLLANQYDDKNELLEELTVINNIHCDPPLSAGEVAKAMQSPWRYKLENRLMLPGTRGAVIPAALVRDFTLGDKAHRLLGLLISEHAGKNEPFAVGIDGLHTLTGWAPNTLRGARDELLERGHLTKVKHGGRGEHDPSLYRLNLQGFKN
jgi:hypothetical protein